MENEADALVGPRTSKSGVNRDHGRSWKLEATNYDELTCPFRTKQDL